MTLKEKRDMYVFFHKMDQIAEAKQRRLQRLQEEKQKKETQAVAKPTLLVPA
jgi:hypothetical protein